MIHFTKSNPWKCLVVVSISFFLSIRILAFESGSDGSFGAINVTEDATIALPSDGLIHATTINVVEGATLTFERNVFNTPVYLLATGDVTVSGTIDVSGKTGTALLAGESGPGGFDGGRPGAVDVPASDGQGPGGGKAGISPYQANQQIGAGSYATKATGQASVRGGETYGSALLIPIIGGSGGGGADQQPQVGGSGGGGALLIASDTQIEISATGKLYANGGAQSGSFIDNGGSGGAVRLVAPKVFGTGEIRCVSRLFNGNLNRNVQGGYGRIRIDTTDTDELDFDVEPEEFTTVGPNMVVFPGPFPRLDITEAAGQSVNLGIADPVVVDLDFNADPNQTIKVRAENFNKVVHFAVVLHPVNGDRTIYEDSIDNSSGDPVTKDINVVLPLNTQTEVFVWTIPDPA